MRALNLTLCVLLVIVQAHTSFVNGLPSLFSNDGNEAQPVVSFSIENHQNTLFDRQRARQPQNDGFLPNSVPPGGVCSADVDCSGYPLAYCSGTCMCRDGSLNAGSTCVDRGIPTIGNCPASQVYVAEAGTCMTIVKPGEPCQYSQQCSGSEVGAFCIAQRCRCVYGMTTTADGKCTFMNPECTQRGTIWIQELGECKQVIAPGARTCTHHQQCEESFVNSVCFLQKCSCPSNTPVAVDGTCGVDCPSGQTYSGVLSRCISTVQPGNRCQYSSQCHSLHPGMVCERGICRCPNGQVWTGTMCTASCPLGYITDPNTGICKQGCQGNEVEYQGNCLPYVSPGSPCQVNAQCQGGSSCINGICECPSGTNNQFGTCQQIESPPGGPCGNGEICIGGSFCQGIVCTCPTNMVISNRQCITPQTVPPGYPCQDETVICGGGSNCNSDFLCECLQGEVIRDNQCSEPLIAFATASCRNQEVCIESTFCAPHGICECENEEHIIRDGRCIPRPQVSPGQSCADGEVCIHDSYCQRGICVCHSDHYILDDYCVPKLKVPPGYTCGDHAICIGNSSCIDDICRCEGSRIIMDGHCVHRPEALPGYPCRENIEKCLGGSFCDLERRVCACPEDKVIKFNECREPIRDTKINKILMMTVN